MMGRIFLECEEVYVWLGREADDTSILLEYFATVEPIGRYLPKLSIGHLKALFELPQRDYWKRTWIVQEIHLKKAPILVHCGCHQMPLKRLQERLNLVNEAPTVRRFAINPGETYPSYYEPGVLLRNLRESLMHNLLSQTAFGLSSLLVTNRDTLCTDPRDKVYALRGLAEDIRDTDLLPRDYNKRV